MNEKEKEKEEVVGQGEEVKETATSDENPDVPVTDDTPEEIPSPIMADPTEEVTDDQEEDEESDIDLVLTGDEPGEKKTDDEAFFAGLPDMEHIPKEDIIDLQKLIVTGDKLVTLAESLSKEQTRLGVTEFNIQLNTIGSFVELINRKIIAYTDQTQFLKMALTKSNPAKFANEYVDEENGIKLDNRPLTSKSTTRHEVTGRQAQLMILAAAKNIKRSYLYNSGFFITLRSPTLGEINTLYSTLNDSTTEYGSQFGALFYMFSDFLIKDILWRFIELLVIDSNLTGWKKGRRLASSVSINDFDFILLMIATLIYKNGYNFVHLCSKPTCAEKYEELIDLNLLQQTDFSKLSDDQIDIIKKPKVTASEAKKYQDLFCPEEAIKVGMFDLTQKVPSVAKFLAHGKNFNLSLNNAVSDMTSDASVRAFLNFNYTRMFAPWVSRVETGNLVTSDEDAIVVALNQIQEEQADNLNLKDLMEDFMGSSKVTHIGYRVGACDKCDTIPDDTVEGFTALDIQRSFFTMLVMRLIQAS